MNERLPEGKTTKQEGFLPVNQVHQRGGAPCEVSGYQQLPSPNQIRASCHETLHVKKTS